jgi:hypothetical protein
VHAAWGLGVLVAALAGMAVGALAMRYRVASAAPEAPVVVKGDPIVEIQYPEGARVTVGGRVVTDPSPAAVTVVPGAPTVVRLERPGQPAAETTVQLDYNQLRVVSFVTRELSGKEP